MEYTKNPLAVLSVCSVADIIWCWGSFVTPTYNFCSSLM